MSKKSKKRKLRTSGSPAWMVAGSVGKGTREDYQNWRDRGFYSSKSSSEVRRVDPATGEFISADVLEALADDILKTDRKIVKLPKRRRDKKARTAVSVNAPSSEEKDKFYKSWEWRKLRMQVLKLQGRACQCCGATPNDTDVSGRRVKIVVDHIRPISKYWNLRLQRSNLQVLCDECNQGKGNWDETDFRKPDAPDEWLVEGDVDPALVHQLTDLTTGRLQ